MKNTQGITTMEQVQGELTAGAVLQYGPLVFATTFQRWEDFRQKSLSLLNSRRKQEWR